MAPFCSRPSPKLVLIILQLCRVALPLMSTTDCAQVVLPAWGQHLYAAHWSSAQPVSDPPARIISLLLAKLGDLLVPGLLLSLSVSTSACVATVWGLSFFVVVVVVLLTSRGAWLRGYKRCLATEVFAWPLMVPDLAGIFEKFFLFFISVIMLKSWLHWLETNPAGVPTQTVGIFSPLKDGGQTLPLKSRFFVSSCHLFVWSWLHGFMAYIMIVKIQDIF